MARVFTIYNCGTGFNRDKTDEIIANLASRTEGSENRDWMINDGVGSKPEKGSKAIRPGFHDPITGFKIKTPWFAKMKGTTEGYGWEHNVQHAMAVIKALLAGSNMPPTLINMAGWSRGAITCHMLAHAMAADPDTRHLPVNLFAFDPVPGPDNFKMEMVSVPDNVQNYSAIIMEDESRKIMRPVIFTQGDDDGGGKFKMYTLPGAHNTGVFRVKSEVGTIGAALVHKFLTKHGTQLKNPILLSNLQYCELYAKVRIDIDKFRSMKGSKAQRKLLGDEPRTVRNDFRDTAYFINDHHASKFQKVFPGMWQMLAFGAPSQQALEQQAQMIRNMAPTTYLSLQEVGII